jgi:hypothetical protein
MHRKARMRPPHPEPSQSATASSPCRSGRNRRVESTTYPARPDAPRVQRAGNGKRGRTAKGDERQKGTERISATVVMPAGGRAVQATAAAGPGGGGDFPAGPPAPVASPAGRDGTRLTRERWTPRLIGEDEDCGPGASGGWHASRPGACSRPPLPKVEGCRAARPNPLLVGHNGRHTGAPHGYSLLEAIDRARGIPDRPFFRRR